VTSPNTYPTQPYLLFPPLGVGFPCFFSLVKKVLAK
jgi:hypothetical protein